MDRSPARLLCPLDSPGKNTGVGFNALLQGTLLQGIFPEPGIEPMSPVAPALQVDSLAPEALISYTPIRSDRSLNRVRLFATP